MKSFRRLYCRWVRWFLNSFEKEEYKCFTVCILCMFKVYSDSCELILKILFAFESVFCGAGSIITISVFDDEIRPSENLLKLSNFILYRYYLYYNTMLSFIFLSYLVQYLHKVVFISCWCANDERYNSLMIRIWRIILSISYVPISLLMFEVNKKPDKYVSKRGSAILRSIVNMFYCFVLLS